MTALLLLTYLAIPRIPELCLTDGKNGYPGQILVVDNKCKFRLRWKTLK